MIDPCYYVTTLNHKRQDQVGYRDLQLKDVMLEL